MFDCGVSANLPCDDTIWANAVLDALDCNGASPCQNIDADRVYTAGGSKGGQMVEKMMCDPDIAANFKGFVALSADVIGLGTSAANVVVSCPYMQTHHDSSMLWTWGTTDTNYYGNSTLYLTGRSQTPGGQAGWMLSQPDNPLVFLVPLLGCNTTPAVTTVMTNVTQTTYTGCTNSRVATGWLRVTGGGHSWNGQYQPASAPTFNIFQYAWDWFVDNYPG